MVDSPLPALDREAIGREGRSWWSVVEIDYYRINNLARFKNQRLPNVSFMMEQFKNHSRTVQSNRAIASGINSAICRSMGDLPIPRACISFCGFLNRYLCKWKHAHGTNNAWRTVADCSIDTLLCHAIGAFLIFSFCEYQRNGEF